MADRSYHTPGGPRVTETGSRSYHIPGGPRITETVSAGAGEISGAFSVTLGVLTSATGTVDVAGALAKTLGTLTSTATGTVDVAGALSKTLGALTSSAAGTVVSGIAGDAAVTLGTLTSTAAGAVAISGAAAVTLGALTSAAAGAVAISGTATQTLGALTSVAAGTVTSDAITGAVAITLGAASSSAAAEVRRVIVPASDLAAGAWQASTGSDLFAMIDDGADPNAADYIFTQSASTAQVSLGSVPPPIAGGQTISYEIRGNGTAGLTVRLKMGGTTIASWTHAPAPATDTRYDQSLSGGEIAAITDYNGLSLEFEATV